MISTNDLVVEDDFQLVEKDGAYRLVSKSTGRQMGEMVQEHCRSMEWRAAGVVYEKYKRKHDLNYGHWAKLARFAMDISSERASKGKKMNFDFLVQLCSEEIKKSFVALL